MAQELVETDSGGREANPADSGSAGPIAALQSLGPGRIIALGVVAVLLLGFFAYIVFRATTPSYGVLFSGLTLDDSRQVVETLQNRGVPYRLSERGDAVLVPSGDILGLRMELAGDGLPAGGVVGYELFDQSSSLTATDFISNVNLRRALEGELSRTIQSLRQVRSARVHIVSPARQPFSRQENKPSASVVIGASDISHKQVGGIRHLVASAVPGMSAGDVSVIDDNGNLLASPDDDDALSQSTRHEEQRGALEQRLRDKIITLLERSVGRGRVDAQVSADIDFDTLTTTTEKFDPEGQVARSVQSIDETNDRDETDNDQAVTVQNNLPAEGQDGAAGIKSTESTSRTEESTNFEISRTVQSQTRVGGVIERLTVAVQVDLDRVVDDAGDTVTQPRDADDIAQLEALVRSAIGFDEERGDWIEVVSRPFFIEPTVEIDEPSMFEFSKEDYWRAFELAVLLILGILGLKMGVKPLLSHTFGIGKERDKQIDIERETGGILDNNGDPIPLLEEGGDEKLMLDGDPQEEEDELIDVLGIDGKVKASLVDKVSEIVEKNPEAGVRVLRGWIHGI